MLEPLKIFPKRSLFILLIFSNYISPLTIQAQNFSGAFIFSSIGSIKNASSNSMPITFVSNLNCLQVNNGASLLVGKIGTGLFSPNCIVNIKFNTLGITIFPNPVQEFATIKFMNTPTLAEIFSISIWSMEGVQIKKITTNGVELKKGKIIDCRNIAAGAFVLQIESSNYVDAIKFIKVK